MADIVASFTGGHAVPDIGYYTVGKSQTIGQGDLVVLATEGTTNITVVRKLTASDISAHYTNTNVAGVLGIAACAIVTDANGVASAQNAPSSVAFGAYPMFSIPNVPASIPGDAANSGRPMLPVIRANDWTEFRIKCQGTSNAAVTVDPDLLGDAIGLQVYATTDFAADTSASGSDLCAVVSRLDELDPYYNTSSALCHVYIKIKPAYQQALTGVTY